MSQSELWGGLSGRQMSRILGVPETRVNQAAIPALDRAAVIAMVNAQAFFRMLADRMKEPTEGMYEILGRRKRMLKAISEARRMGEMNEFDERFSDLRL